METPRKARKQKIGTVLKDRANKSIVVLVNRVVKHPLYKKYVTKSTKLMVHDENNQGKVGDKVEITETRPLSKRKCWRLTNILEKSK